MSSGTSRGCGRARPRRPPRRRPRRSSARSRASRPRPCRAWSPPACRCAGPRGRTACAGRTGSCCSCVTMPARSSACAAGLPLTPLFVRSIRIRWLSVPPETRSKPRSSSASASALALATIGVRVVGELGRGRLVQRDRDRRGRVVVRAALQAGEDRPFDRLRRARAAHQHRAARAAQRLVRRRRDHVGVGDRRRVRAAGDQPGDVRDVGGQDRADLGGDLGEGLEVDRARDRRAAAEDELGRSRSASARTSSRSMRPVSRRTPYCTARNQWPVVETLQPCVRWPPGGSAMPMHRVAGLAEGEVDGEVGGRAGVRLDVGVVDAEQRLRALDGERLDARR